MVGPEVGALSIDKAIRERQSEVSRSGRGWEDYVASFLNSRLRGSGIDVARGGSESMIRARDRNLWRTLVLAGDEKGPPIWGDIDLVALKRNKPIAVVSCKTSLHGRLTETLFYYLLFKPKGIQVVLATCDAGSGSANNIRSEWGTSDNPTKNRSLAEIFLDGVYVENVAKFTPSHIKTALGGKVKRLSELPTDLEKWS